MSVHILVVDDEPDVELLVKHQFRDKIKKNNYHFVFAQNGEEALGKLNNDVDIELILSDINMPVMDGLTLLSEISKLERILKVVMVSAYDDMENIRVAMNRGAFDFVTKPIDFKDLEITIGKTLETIDEIKESIRSKQENELLKMYNERLKKEIDERTKAEKALRDSEDRFRQLAESTFEGLVVHNQGTILDANQALQKLLTYHLSELLELDLLSLFSKEYQPLIKKSINSRDFSIEAECIKKDGSLFQIEAMGKSSPYRGNNVEIIAIRDITERKRVERLREDTERIVRHDLKNPLTGILGFASLLIESDALEEDKKKWARFILDLANQMLHMINHSLDLFKMEEGTYQLKTNEFDILMVFQKLDQEFINYQKYGFVELVFNIDDRTVSKEDVYRICGEKVHLESMFANLIKNALEASPKNSKITISIIGDEVEGFHQFCIHNVGMIPKEIHSSLFHRYVTKGKKGGTGLGCYSALLIAKAHQGDIKFISSEENGTSLYVSLPKEMPIQQNVITSVLS